MGEELRKTPLELRETKKSGGGAQIEFLSLDDEGLGLRLYKDTEFPRSDLATERAKALAENSQLRWALAECLLSFNLPEDVQKATPAVKGIGLYIPKGEGSFYFEVDPGAMKGEGVYEVLNYICSEGADLGGKGIESNIFTLVEKVPMAVGWGEENPDVFYSPRTLAESDPETYRQGLINGLKFYQAAEYFGMWNFDIREKDPFLCDRQGNVRVIDTSGFQALGHSKAEGFMKGFYEQEMTKLEEVIRDEVTKSQPDSLQPNEREEYDRLSGEIKSLREKGRELLSFLRINISITNYSEVEIELELEEKKFNRELEDRKLVESRLEEFRAQVEKQEGLKIQSETRLVEVGKELEDARKKLFEAKSAYERLLAIEELKKLADEFESSGRESLNQDNPEEQEIFDKLKLLPSKTGIEFKRRFPSRHLIWEILDKTEALEKEKPLSERKEEAQKEAETAKAELEKLQEESQELSGTQVRVIEPSEYELMELEEKLKRLKSPEEIKALKEKIARVGEIIEEIKKHSSLDHKVSYSRKQAEKKAAIKIEVVRDVLFEDELPKTTNMQLTQVDIGEFLRECGLELFLETTKLEKLRGIYERIKGGRYSINDPRVIINFFITRLEEAKIS